MTFEKTWSFALNTVPTDQSTNLQRIRSWGYQLKSFLVSTAGWTVTASSDSSTSSSSDLWSGLSALVFNSEGSAHSWIVIKSPVGIVAGANGSYTGDQSRLWVCIFCGRNDSYQEEVKFSYHREAPTGGSTTATPTSTNQIIRPYWANASISNSHFHFACTSAGNFWAAGSQDGAAKLWQMIGILPLGAVSQINSTSLDYPYGAVIIDTMRAYDTDAGGNFLKMQNLAPQTNWHGNIQAWNADGTWTPALSGTYPYGNVRMMVLGNSAPTYSSFPGGWIGYSFASGGDSVNSLQQYGQVHVQIESPGKTAYLGRLADIYGSGGGTPQLSVDSISSPTMQYTGNLWLPVNTVMTM